VWDDGYGISVPKAVQTVKASISEALSGFTKTKTTNGIYIYRVKGWDYAQMCEAFEEGIALARSEHVPVLFHVEELTQPQGHSTSGSHERYKTPERLQWEREWDCLPKMRTWIVENALATEEEIVSLEETSRAYVMNCRQETWKMYDGPIQEQKSKVLRLINEVVSYDTTGKVEQVKQELLSNTVPFRRDVISALRKTISLLKEKGVVSELEQYNSELKKENETLFNSYLYFNENHQDQINELPEGLIQQDGPVQNGYEILNKYFDELFATNKKVVAFGEDLGKIGDVNQGFAGLQQKHGAHRIFDTGIR
jgi:collagenase-like PrtC family protease